MEVQAYKTSPMALLTSVYSGLLGVNLPPSKNSDSPPKVVSDCYTTSLLLSHTSIASYSHIRFESN